MKRRGYFFRKAQFLLCLALGASMPLLAQTGPEWGLSFDGVDEFVSVPHRPELNGLPLTISAWIKTSETNGVRMIASKYSPEFFNGYQLYLVNGQASARYFKDVSARLLSEFDASEDRFVADGNWHHLALVVAANGSGFFIDGKAKGTWTWLGAPGACTNELDLVFGREFRPYPPFDRYWHGLIDEVAIWNVARSRSELQNGLYQHLTGGEPGLVASWQMDEGAGLTILDASEHHFNGHLINGPAWTKTDAPARGSALVFSGSDDHLRVPKFGLSAPTNDITVEFWLRSGSVNEQVLFSLQPDLSGNRIAARIVPNDGEVYCEF